MIHFLEFVLRSLVGHPDDLDIREVNSDSTVTFYVTIHPEDIGKVIGKSGKTIGAIRNLLNAAASRTNQRVVVKVSEP